MPERGPAIWPDCFLWETKAEEWNCFFGGVSEITHHKLLSHKVYACYLNKNIEFIPWSYS